MIDGKGQALKKKVENYIPKIKKLYISISWIGSGRWEKRDEEKGCGSMHRRYL